MSRLYTRFLYALSEHFSVNSGVNGRITKRVTGERRRRGRGVRKEDAVIAVIPEERIKKAEADPVAGILTH